MQTREPLGGSSESLFLLAECEAHLMRAIGGIIVKARSRDYGDADSLHNVAREGYVIGESKARNIRHDVVGATGTKTLETGVFEYAQHTIALGEITFRQALVIGIRQFEGEGAGGL